MLAIDQLKILEKIVIILSDCHGTELSKPDLVKVNFLMKQLGLQQQYDQITKVVTDHHGSHWLGHTKKGELINVSMAVDAMVSGISNLLAR